MKPLNLIPGIKNNEITIILISPDESYKQDIISYYNQSEQNISVTDGGNSIEEWAQQPTIQKGGILIIEQTEDIFQYKNQLVESGINKVIILTNHLNDLHSNQDSSIFVQNVYKYSHFHLLTQKIILFYFEAHLQPDLSASHSEKIKNLHKQKRVVFYSPKGGVGKTVVSVNVACHLAAKGLKVLLVDFSQFGSLSVIFQSTRTKNIGDAIGLLEQSSTADVTEMIQVISEAVYETEILPEKSISILSAASHVKMANLTLDHTDRLLEAIQSFPYDIIICDTSSEISPKNISLLSWASDLFLLTASDVMVNWNLFASQDLLQQIQNPLQTQYLILNRYHSTYSIKQEEVEKLLSRKIDGVIPDFETQLQNYINRGVLLISKPGLKIHKYFKRIAHSIQPVFSDKEQGLKKKRIKR